jgi:flavin-binding protein dodecin
MAESVYTVIALVGTSTESLRDLRLARVVEQDIHLEPGKPLTYRVKVEVSFKYEAGA